ncbi:MAG: extracellular solute-binding protein [Planctomycetota bacterium]
MKGLLLALSLAAPAPAPAPEPPERELRVMVFDPTSLTERWRKLQDLAERFEREHPGVRVRLLADGGSASLTKLNILLAAREPIDVVWCDVVEFTSLWHDGALLDLQPYFDADSAWRPEEYFPGPLDAFRGSDGHLFGLPSTFTPYVMYVNRDILAEEGLAFPAPEWTWDDLRDIALRCTGEREDGYRWGLSITQWLQALAPWIWQNGGRFLSEDLSRCTLDEPEAVEALDFLLRLFHEDRVVATDATYEGQVTRGEFQAGNVALYGPVGYWEVYRFKQITDFAWDVHPLPRRQQAATSVALRSYCVTRYTGEPQLAYEFVRMLAGEDMSRTLARIGNGVPGLRAVAESEDFLRPDVAPDSEHVFIDVMEHARFLPVHASWREIESVVRDELQGALLFGKYDAETACRRMTDKVNAFLERERADRSRPRANVPLLGLALAGAAGLALLVGVRLMGPRPGALRRREERAAARLLALWGTGFVAFTLGPMLATLGLSLLVWTPVRPLLEARWAGLDNYAELTRDDAFGQALAVTASYTLLSVPLTLALALGLAVLVRRGLAVFRTIFYLPVVASAVAVGVIWRWILGSGFVEAALGAKWIESEAWIVPGFVLMSLWSIGGPMLVFLAALQGIDGALYEAARVDGASRWRQFLHVTVPQLTPAILFNLVIGLINASQTFAQPYVMTDGGPGNASLFYVLYLYRTAFRFHRMGYASALAWVLFVALLALTLLVMRSSRRWVHYEGRVA